MKKMEGVKEEAHRVSHKVHPRLGDESREFFYQFMWGQDNMGDSIFPSFFKFIFYVPSFC